MLIPMRPILEAADRLGYGQTAFNMNSVSQVIGALRIHEIMESPAILQGAEASNAFMGGAADFFHGSAEQKRRGAENLGRAVRRYGGDSPVPVALHLDHGKSLDTVKACIDGGYTSVMIDGSDLPYEQNVELTRQAVLYAHAFGVTVEGELGVLAGVEDQVFGAGSTYTNPLQAVDFFKKTGCDALAVSYGTCHGPNKGHDARLRWQIPAAIRECMRHESVRGFLVSHGSSTVPQAYVDEINAMGGRLTNTNGIPVEQLAAVCRYGISKINVDTDLRLACTRDLLRLFSQEPALRQSPAVGGVYQAMRADPANFDPRGYVGGIMDAVMYGDPADPDTARLDACIQRSAMRAVAPLLVQFGSFRRWSEVEPVTCEQMADRYKRGEA